MYLPCVRFGWWPVHRSFESLGQGLKIPAQAELRRGTLRGSFSPRWELLLHAPSSGSGSNPTHLVSEYAAGGTGYRVRPYSRGCPVQAPLGRGFSAGGRTFTSG